MKLESLKTITGLAIPTNRIFYDKKSNVISVEIMDFMFVGIYKKSTKLSLILNDIFASLKDVQLNRTDISIIDFVTNTKIPETTKLKNLKLLSKKKSEKKVEKPEEKKELMVKEKEIVFETEEEPEEQLTLKDAMEKELFKLKEDKAFDQDLEELSSYDDDVKYGEGYYEEEEYYEEEKVLKREEIKSEESRRMREAPKAKKKARAYPSPPHSAGGAPASAPGGPPVKTPAPAVPPPPPASDMLAGPGVPPPKPVTEPSTVIPEEPQPTVYKINMGLQYYSVMMEQRSYLFYVYFSHKELKIVDEEGKTIYETTFTIVTRKAEPPVLDLKIEGEGFEVHPIFGKVEVKKDAVNPPVMIFSIMPLKSKKMKKKKKESERRFLNVYIEFEEQIISHTILSIIVQPKYFRLELGPIHLNLSRKAAAIISFISIIIAGISLVYTFFSWDPTSSFVDILSGFAPGLGSIVFIAIFLITLFKEGIYPLKEKISAFLNFDQTGVLIK
ncbi:MAG: hypothetical protein ACFFCV_02115 [Promethearchaeota archaeon]